MADKVFKLVGLIILVILISYVILSYYHFFHILFSSRNNIKHVLFRPCPLRCIGMLSSLQLRLIHNNKIILFAPMKGSSYATSSG